MCGKENAADHENYGGTLTPAEAARAINGKIPKEMARTICGTKFPARLAKEFSNCLRNADPGCQLAKEFLAAWGGNGANQLAAASFAAKYRAEINASPACQGVNNLWKKPEWVFMAAWVATQPNPPAHYLAFLASKRNRNTRSRAEWELMQAEAHPS